MPHDVLTPAPHSVHLERAYLEWSESVFGKLTADGSPSPSNLSCGQCHLPGRMGRAAERDGAPERLIHDHSMPAVDLALTPFPNTEAQRAGVQRDLDTAVQAKLKEQNQLYDLFANRGSDIFLRFSANGEVLHVSPSHERILGRGTLTRDGRLLGLALEHDALQEFVERHDAAALRARERGVRVLRLLVLVADVQRRQEQDEQPPVFSPYRF